MKKFKYGLREDYTIHNAYCDLMKKLHCTHTQMSKMFPDLYEAKWQEELNNVRISSERTCRKILNLRKSKV